MKMSAAGFTPEIAWRLNVRDAVCLCTSNWNGDNHNHVLVADKKAFLHVIDDAGVPKDSIPLPLKPIQIECGQTRSLGDLLLAYGEARRQVWVFDRQGKKVWSYRALFGVDGAHWGDLNGDGDDEMILGMNAFGGVHAVAGNGRRLWHRWNAINVWNQAVIPAHEKQPGCVFVTDARGIIRLFDADGQNIRQLRPGGWYYSAMTAARMDQLGTIQIIAIGTNKDRACLAAMDEQGEVAWSLPFSNAFAIDQTNFVADDIDQDGISEWVVQTSTDSLMIVSAKGESIGSIKLERPICQFALIKDSLLCRLLVVLCDDNSLRAYRLRNVIQN